MPRVRRTVDDRDAAARSAPGERGPREAARELDLPLRHHLHGRRMGRNPSGGVRARGRRGGDGHRSRRSVGRHPYRGSRSGLSAALLRALRTLRGGHPDPVRDRISDRRGTAPDRRDGPPGAGRPARRRIRRKRGRRCLASGEDSGVRRRRGRLPDLLRRHDRLRRGDQHREGAGGRLGRGRRLRRRGTQLRSGGGARGSAPAGRDRRDGRQAGAGPGVRRDRDGQRGRRGCRRAGARADRRARVRHRDDGGRQCARHRGCAPPCSRATECW